mmetsp:Transcript_30551/g.76474  ORF Transcript_30551/g.76474 Transcript_30551/m.76474 type:complete len:210 (+) Transcript_30551:1338-1967(+)
MGAEVRCCSAVAGGVGERRVDVDVPVPVRRVVGACVAAHVDCRENLVAQPGREQRVPGLPPPRVLMLPVPPLPVLVPVLLLGGGVGTCDPPVAAGVQCAMVQPGVNAGRCASLPRAPRPVSVIPRTPGCSSCSSRRSGARLRWGVRAHRHGGIVGVPGAGVACECAGGGGRSGGGSSWSLPSCVVSATVVSATAVTGDAQARQALPPSS